MDTNNLVLSPPERSELAVILDNTSIKARFIDALGHRGAGMFISGLLTAVKNNPVLKECTPMSVVTAAMGCAALDLVLEPSLGQAALVPFNSKNGKHAQLIVMARGLEQLALRTQQYTHLHVFPVYEGEGVEEDRITGKVSLTGRRTSDKVVAWGAYFRLVNGFEKWLTMSITEIHEHAMRYSKAYHNTDGFWKKNPVLMEKKTLLRAILKHGPMLHNEELKNVLAYEDGEIVEAELQVEPETEPQPETPTKTVGDVMSELYA
jgi:recombination protein RecT